MDQDKTLKKRLLHGVGYNDADYAVTRKVDGKTVTCPIYSRWKNMIERCYSEKYHERYPCYADCSVSDEWKRFSSFALWFSDHCSDLSWHLDKDILVRDNKVYSAETCMIVPPNINVFCSNSIIKPFDSAHGVSLNRVVNLFKVEFKCEGEAFYLGYYESPVDALSASLNAKASILRGYAEGVTEGSDARLGPALTSLSNRFFELALNPSPILSNLSERYEWASFLDKEEVCDSVGA